MELPEKLKREVEEKVKDLPDEIKQEIFNKIKERYEKSLVDIGEPVGIIASQSIAEPTTQMILRTFHYVGARQFQVSLTLPGLIEIIDARKKKKHTYMIIRLLDEYKRDKEVAERVANRLREVKLKDIAEEIGLDLFEKMIIIKLNKENIKRLGLDLKSIEEILKKKLKRYKVEFEGEYIKIHYDKDYKELYRFRDNLRNLHIYGIRGIKDVVIRLEGEEWVIYTYGSNLKEVMKIPEVDYTKIYTNDIHEVEKVLGIEAARNVILNEIKNIFEQQGLKVDIRHFMLLADVLTWYGEYLGVTRYGLHAEKYSTLAKAAFETPIQNIIRSAMINAEDDFKTAIENLMANQVVPLGTGLFNIYYKKDKEPNS